MCLLSSYSTLMHYSIMAPYKIIIKQRLSQNFCHQKEFFLLENYFWEVKNYQKNFTKCIRPKKDFLWKEKLNRTAIFLWLIWNFFLQCLLRRWKILCKRITQMVVLRQFFPMHRHIWRFLKNKQFCYFFLKLIFPLFLYKKWKIQFSSHAQIFHS